MSNAIEQAREALAAVVDAMLYGGDGAVGDFGWNISKLTKARPLIRTAHDLLTKEAISGTPSATETPAADGGVERFGYDFDNKLSDIVICHQLRTSAGLMDEETKKRTGWADTSDRAGRMREAADLIERLIAATQTPDTAGEELSAIPSPRAGHVAEVELLLEALDSAAWHLQTIATDIRNPGQRAMADKWIEEARTAHRRAALTQGQSK